MSNTWHVNSREYWDNRFHTDWEEKSGPKQSRFFSDVTISVLPEWVIRHLKRSDADFVDWGCAQGDGTEAWTHLISPSRITGVDFSQISIAQATSRYPALRFKCENWLLPTKTRNKRYSVLFSSNTLEHFPDPFSTLAFLSGRARAIMIIAVPFAEFERFREHMFTFVNNNVPAVVGTSWFLAYTRVVDCRSLPGSMWAGDQGIFVYVHTSAAVLFGLTLSDMSIQANSQSKSASTAQVSNTDTRLAHCLASLDTSPDIQGSDHTTPARIAVTRVGQQLSSIERLLSDK